MYNLMFELVAYNKDDVLTQAAGLPIHSSSFKLYYPVNFPRQYPALLNGFNLCIDESNLMVWSIDWITYASSEDKLRICKLKIQEIELKLLYPALNINEKCLLQTSLRVLKEFFKQD